MLTDAEAWFWILHFSFHCTDPPSRTNRGAAQEEEDGGRERQERRALIVTSGWGGPRWPLSMASMSPTSCLDSEEAIDFSEAEVITLLTLVSSLPS